MTSQPSFPPPDASFVGADLGYYSHFPVLARALAMTEGPVLELGMGWGSTPLLYAVCSAQQRPVSHWETDQEWAERFIPGFQTLDNEIQVTDDWDEAVHDVRTAHWAVIFIDCAPGEIRKDLALKLKDHAEFIILHDHEAGPGAAYYYEEIIPRWKYAEVYRLLRPHTLILSDTRPFGLSRFEQGFPS